MHLRSPLCRGGHDLSFNRLADRASAQALATSAAAGYFSREAMTSSDSNSPPSFDEVLAASYVGKYILVGVTYADHTGRELRRQQIHGVIESASLEGIRISLRGAHEGHSWNMPPALSAIQKADPGTYTLYMSGETIENPDLLAIWTITEPPPMQ